MSKISRDDSHFAHSPPTDQPTRERWTIHVCSDCGEPGYKFISEHSIPLVCADPDSAYAGEHSGKPREVEVVPASRLASVEAERDRLNAEVERLRDLIARHANTVASSMSTDEWARANVLLRKQAGVE